MLQASYKGIPVLDQAIGLYNYMWKKFLPMDPIVIDQLIIPAGVDFDSLSIGVDSSNSFVIASQLTRKKPTMLMEKLYYTKQFEEETKIQQQ